ncbi:MAG: TetR/AcrR family transcriptional regulator [Synergistetes bacterium]|nr:TetR/AcrR family transcriptional regulator [Synergistota bacterium]MCX8127599.1 TetR/AcrR family transcriptional regulator [Synergistota bacterium]MDW8191484.1 TetR/AcrR family transcriptional regulator [Synergistota bacterium]
MIKISKKGTHERKALTREKILNAALECFAQKGFKETTVDEIAKRAKVSKGNIYWHFKSKFEIFRELIKEEVKKIHQLIEEEGDDSLSLKELWRRKTEKAFALIGKLEKQLKVFYEILFSAWKTEEAKNFFLEIEEENINKHRRILEGELKVRNLHLSETDLEHISKLLTLLHYAIVFRVLLFQGNESLWKELKEMTSSFFDILAFYIYKRGDQDETTTK